jgi:dihydrofolate reductase
MRKLSVFNSVSIDGYFTDAHGDMSWAHRQDPEWEAFASENASGGGVLLFGRITYELRRATGRRPRRSRRSPWWPRR